MIDFPTLQILRVYVPSYESYGRMWPHMHTRIVVALMVYQITMIGFMLLKKLNYPILVPLLPISIIFSYVCHMRFYPAFAKTPLEVAAQHDSKETPNMESIYAAYIPLCLKPDKLEDLDVFEDAQSHSTSRPPSI